jgi:4a-hydroxytetrahydrobiopterin dehydratase
MTSFPDSPPGQPLQSADAERAESPVRPIQRRPAARWPATEELPAGWLTCTDRPAIERHYRFPDFNSAFAFMTRVALLAERMDHHPEWRNVWNRVDMVLTTHDAGGVTDLDLRMASEAEAFARSLGGS